MKNLLLLMLLAIGMSTFSQVAVNTDGSLPDISAMLDVKSTSKGMLAPRMTQTQRIALANPATGLLVFQTDGTAGLYYNSGTPAVPNWKIVGSNAGQWLNNGTSIYYNGGNVGIGLSAPSAYFHVAENSPGFTAAFGTNISSWNSSTNVSIGDDNGHAILYVGQSTSNEGLLYWNHNPTPVNSFLSLSVVAGTNPVILQEAGGKVGIGTVAPAAMLHVNENIGNQTAAFGTAISPYTANTNVSVGNDDGDSYFYVGQSPGNNGFLAWTYNATPSSAHFGIGTYNGNNPLILQETGGSVGIGTTTPSGKLEIVNDIYSKTYLGYTNTWTDYIDHTENPADGDGQNGIYSFRDRISANDGTGYSNSASNCAVQGNSYWGDLYSFGLSGFNYNDYTRCGGTLGANTLGSYWGSMGYKNSSSTPYGGYFTSYTSGAGKSSQADISVGIGAWGDLMGADIHGKVYGVYAEGNNYAMFSNGVVYKNNLDVHLQENGTSTNTVLYTSVSADVTVQTCGYATLADGFVSIDFDPAFAAAVSSKSPVVVTVTPTGSSNGVYLSEVNSRGFKVAENNNGKSSVTISYIAIGKRAGYEHPSLPREVIESNYTKNLSRGLHNDADTHTNGEGLYYEGGNLVVGIHPSTLPDPIKLSSEKTRQNSVKPGQSSQSYANVKNQSVGRSGSSGPVTELVKQKKVVEDFSEPSPAYGKQASKEVPEKK